MAKKGEKMKIRLAGDIQTDSIVDGEGIRTVIWTQGCSHNCKGCHNPETHDHTKGNLVDVEEIKQKLSKVSNQDGVTLSGGDPFFQIEASGEIAKYCKETGLNVWAYTGFTFEKLNEMSKHNDKLRAFMENIDVLVDGKFELEQRSLNLKFKGSRNQRVLDMQESLKEDRPVVIEKYNKESVFLGYDCAQKEKEFLYI